MYAGSITKNFENIDQNIDNSMKQLLTEEQRSVLESFIKRLHTSGPKYYECLKKTDDGFWHDNAGAILQQASSTALLPTQQQKLTTFIHTIAKRLFLINYDVKKDITYQFDALNHRVEHDDFHVIIRREKGEVLIFFCAKDQQPDNCVLCTKEKALGIAIPHHQAAVAHQPAGLPQDAQDAQVAQYNPHSKGVEV